MLKKIDLLIYRYLKLRVYQMTQVKEDNSTGISVTTEEYCPKHHIFEIFKYLLIPFVGVYTFLVGMSLEMFFTLGTVNSVFALFVSAGLWFYGFWTMVQFFIFSGIFYGLLQFDIIKEAYFMWCQLLKNASENGNAKAKFVIDCTTTIITVYNNLKSQVNSYWVFFWVSNYGKQLWGLRNYYYKVDKVLNKIVVALGLDKVNFNKITSLSSLKLRRDSNGLEDEFYHKLMSIQENNDESDDDIESSTGAVVGEDMELDDMKEMDDMFKTSHGSMSFNTEDQDKMETELKKLRSKVKSNPMPNMQMPNKEQFAQMKDIFNLLPDDFDLPGPMGKSQKVSEIKKMMQIVEKNSKDLDLPFFTSNDGSITPPRPKSSFETKDPPAKKDD